MHLHPSGDRDWSAERKQSPFAALRASQSLRDIEAAEAGGDGVLP